MSTQQSLFEKAFRNAPIGMCLVSLDGRFVNANSALSNMLGYSEDELYHLRFSDVTHPDDLEKELEHWNDLIARKSDYYQIEKRYIHKEGYTVWGLLTVFVITDGFNKPKYFVAQVIDLTMIQSLKEQLSEHQERYRILEQSLLDMISEHTPDGLFKYLSPSCKNILGYEPEELIHRSLYELIHPEDYENVLHFHIVCLEGQREQSLTFRIRKKDGSYIWLDTAIRPIFSANGHVKAFICLSRDTTERKHSESLLIQSEKLAIVGQLAAGIAHEIRNPLTALRGFLDLMEKGESKKMYFDIMRSELERIEYILSELLVVSKPQAVTYKHKNLVKILKDVCTLMESQASLHNVEIITNMDVSSILIKCDENQMKQAFLNFIKNAIEAMPQGGHVYLTVRPVGRKVIIEIRDEGNGIPEEILQNLGQPFYSTKEKGTGLGLMVSYKIIKDHMGTISIDTQVGKGTCFRIELPKHPSRLESLNA
jgi:two-component system sporulation sensor kinase A